MSRFAPENFYPKNYLEYVRHPHMLVRLAILAVLTGVVAWYQPTQLWFMIPLVGVFLGFQYVCYRSIFPRRDVTSKTFTEMMEDLDEEAEIAKSTEAHSLLVNGGQVLVLDTEAVLTSPNAYVSTKIEGTNGVGSTNRPTKIECEVLNCQVCREYVDGYNCTLHAEANESPLQTAWIADRQVELDVNTKAHTGEYSRVATNAALYGTHDVGSVEFLTDALVVADELRVTSSLDPVVTGQFGHALHCNYKNQPVGDKGCMCLKFSGFYWNPDEIALTPSIRDALMSELNAEADRLLREDGATERVDAWAESFGPDDTEFNAEAQKANEAALEETKEDEGYKPPRFATESENLRGVIESGELRYYAGLLGWDADAVVEQARAELAAAEIADSKKVPACDEVDERPLPRKADEMQTRAMMAVRPVVRKKRDDDGTGDLFAPVTLPKVDTATVIEKTLGRVETDPEDDLVRRVMAQGRIAKTLQKDTRMSRNGLEPGGARIGWEGRWTRPDRLGKGSLIDAVFPVVAPTPTPTPGTVLQAPEPKRQVDKVRYLLSGGLPMTLGQLARAVGCTESSVASRIRDLRLPAFGGLTITKEHLRTSGRKREFTYRMVK